MSFSKLCVSKLTQETDKATMEVEAQDDGVLAKIIVRSAANPGASRLEARPGELDHRDRR